ncbi:MAG: AraC family transcriptional regulator [Kineosporiaceae bacterium]
MSAVVRSSVLRGFREVVGEAGGDPGELLARYRIPAAALDADDVLVGLSGYGRLLESAARELGCPDLGLRLAEHQDLDTLGPVALAVANAGTVGRALEYVGRFLHVHSPALSLSEVPDPEGDPQVAGLRYAVAAVAGPPAPQGADLALAMTHRALTSLVGGSYGLRGVHLAHLPQVPLERYERVFGAPVQAGRADPVLRLGRAAFPTPLRGGDPAVRDIAVEYLSVRYAAPGANVTPATARVVERHLPQGPPRIGDVAAALGLHPRTLQRHLDAEGTSFGAVVDDARRRAAHALLTAGDLPLTRVAAAVGLAEQSALTRCVRRWYGTTPTALRREARAGRRGGPRDGGRGSGATSDRNSGQNSGQNSTVA